MSAISIRKLSKKYGDFLALDQVDLEVKEGQLFALLGPNGAGKSTLMRVLTTQLKSSGGEASIFGKDVETDAESVKALIGYVPQEMSVWTDITGYENLLVYSKIYGLPKDKRDKIISDALAIMDLEGVKDRMAATYSGGMIRKLEIASAIMLNPKILFLDEPTIGLDPAARKAVWEKLKKLNEENGISVFFTTHYMDEADSYADSIAIINAGKIAKTGTAEELKKSSGSESIELELSASISSQEIADLRSIKGISDVKLAGNKLQIFVADAGHSLESIISEVLALKIGVVDISISKPTLYDAFMKYAGTDLRDSEERAGLDELKKTRKRITRG